MSKVGILRYLGNICLILGYQTMLWGDFKFGLVIKCIGARNLIGTILRVWKKELVILIVGLKIR